MMNEFVRRHSPSEAWADSAITSANAATLQSIYDDLLPIYNRIAKQRADQTVRVPPVPGTEGAV
jgi:hypothetical protein